MNAAPTTCSTGDPSLTLTSARMDGLTFAEDHDPLPGQGEKMDVGETEVAKRCRAAAAQGHASAQHQLGGMLEAGSEGVAQSWPEAAAWYRRAADQGHAAAQYRLARLYWYGRSGEEARETRKKAVEWYRRAADQGDSEAQYLMSRWCHTNTVQGRREGLAWLRRAAGPGGNHPIARRNLPETLIECAGDEWASGALATAADMLREAFELGETCNAPYLLGRLYDDEEGGLGDAELAASWYARAVDHPHARFMLGRLYDEGRGVAQDPAEAVRLYRLADGPEALLRLGRLLEEGRAGVAGDHLGEAAALYARAADHWGSDEARWRLGRLYATGRGVARDERRAVAEFARAAEFGCGEARFDLGLMHAEGRGTDADDRLALDWFRRAASKGHARAQYNVGLMYEKGRAGLAGDREEAMRRYAAAAASGHAAAQSRLSRLFAAAAAAETKTKQMPTAAAALWEKAEQGDARAQYRVGRLCERGGDGEAQSDARAAEWFGRSAAGGYAKAQLALGRMHEYGRCGVERSEAKALEWYRRAADQGQARAQEILALWSANP